MVKGVKDFVIDAKKIIKKEKNQCYSKIESSLENIKNSQDRIATMKAIDKIIKRSERNA